MTTTVTTTPTPAVIPTGGPTHRSYAQGHVENAPDLTDDHGHTFAPVRVEAHYFRPHATAPWSWYATIHGTNPVGAWRYRLVTSNEENLDGRCPDYVAEFLADRHPGCRRPHPGPAQGHVEDPAAAIRRELTAQLDDLQGYSGPSAAPARRTLTWALGMVDRITNEHALADLAAAPAAQTARRLDDGPTGGWPSPWTVAHPPPEQMGGPDNEAVARAHMDLSRQPATPRAEGEAAS